MLETTATDGLSAEQATLDAESRATANGFAHLFNRLQSHLGAGTVYCRHRRTAIDPN